MIESPQTGFRKLLVTAISVLLLISALMGAKAQAAAGAIAVESFVHEAGGIDYYVEKRGSGPWLVMVTSGQGDSGAYKYLADLLSEDFTVITFDPPGFSRSGPPPTWDNLSTEVLGDQVAEFVRSLGIENATFYGSSSGGMAVLSVVADHPELVRNAIVHEPAAMADLWLPNFLFAKMQKWQADKYGGFAEAERATIYTNTDLIIDPAALEGLGEGHVERRIANKQIWYDRYLVPDVPCCQRKFSAEELNRAPVTVTAGEQTIFLFRLAMKSLANRGNLELVWLPAKHFPYITMPETVADIVRQRSEEHL